MSRLGRHALPALAALALVIAGPSRETFETTHLPKELAAAVLAAALVFRMRRDRPRLDWFDGALVLLGASCLASALLAISPAYGWRPTLLTAAGVTIVLAAREEEERRLWLAWLGGAVCLLAALGLVEVLGWARWSPQGRAPGSLLGQRNTLAHVLVLGAPLLWALALTAPRRLERLAWLVGTAIVAAVVVATRSRAAWLAGPVVLGVFVALARFRTQTVGLRWPVLAVFVGVAAAIAAPAAPGWRAPAPYLDSLRRLTDTTGGSGAGRLEQWSRALTLVPQAPVLGIGPGNWFIAFEREARGGNRFLNSDWVALGVERGALGLLAAAAVVGLLGVTWWRRPGTIEGLPVVGAVAAAAGVTGAFDAVLQLPAAVVLAAVVAGVGLSRGPGFPERSMRWPALAGAALLLLGAAACGLAFASRLVSSAATTTFADLELAVRLDPTDAVTRRELVRADVSARRCDEARPHLPALKSQLPNDAAAREVAEAFGAFCPGR